MEQAIELAQKDYARLLHAHDLRWEIDLVGAVHIYCSCSDEPLNVLKLEEHIRKAVRQERGPTRGPRTKK